MSLESAVRVLVPVSRASRSSPRELDPVAEMKTNLFLLGEGKKVFWSWVKKVATSDWAALSVAVVQRCIFLGDQIWVLSSLGNSLEFPWAPPNRISWWDHEISAEWTWGGGEGRGFSHLDKRQFWQEGVCSHQSIVGETPKWEEKKIKTLNTFLYNRHLETLHLLRPEKQAPLPSARPPSLCRPSSPAPQCGVGES